MTTTEEEEPQVLSIQQRIAALNKAHVGRNTDSNDNNNDAPQPPPLIRPKSSAPPPPVSSRPGTVRNKTFNNPPTNTNGSVVDRPSIGNEPAAAPGKWPLLPPPVPGAKKTPDITIHSADNGVTKPKAPPPLPTRKSSTQQLAPALPPRRPSADFQRRNSQESVASDTSYATATSFSTASTRRTNGAASTASVDSVAGRNLRAPAWGEEELPPLPPRREERPPMPPRPKSSSGRSIDNSSSKGQRPSIKAPFPPPLRESNSTNAADRGRSVPQLPRRPSRTPSNDHYNTEQRRAPSEEAAPRLPIRRLPPPTPSTDAVNKIRKSGFGGLSQNGSAQEPAPSPGPPPVPLSSRPDLSKIQATKPRINASNHSSAAASDVCLICRDFSGPDTHATRYPRETLPSQNLPWLANELTAPFPSATDKARALFSWLHHNIRYDTVAFFNNAVKPSTPAKTLSTGLAVCEGFAGLFATLANYAGLEAVVVGGHGKGYGYAALAPGSPVPPCNPGGHAWNAVKIDNGQWKLIDPCWGAGHCNGPDQPYQQVFSPENFTDSNDIFGLKHFPSNRDHFYRDDGRPSITWEEYILNSGVEQPFMFSDTKKHSIGERSFLPAAKAISISHHQGPIRVQFRLLCEHWTLERHAKTPPGLFLLMIHGIDGREDDRLPFTHFQGSGPNGGGDCWYVDVPDVRMLGAPGQKAQIAVLTSFGDRQDARGLTVQEYQAQVGRVGMAFAFIAQYDIIA